MKGVGVVFVDGLGACIEVKLDTRGIEPKTPGTCPVCGGLGIPWAGWLNCDGAAWCGVHTWFRDGSDPSQFRAFKCVRAVAG